MHALKPAASTTEILFLVQLAATLFMTGVIWFVQVVHYPLFARVGRASFCEYEQMHTVRTGWVVGPPMLVELAAALAGLRLRPEWFSAGAAWTGLALLAVIWLSTGLLQVPLHGRLVERFTEDDAARLTGTNWMRTVCWTLRSLLLLLAIWGAARLG
jgi:hypothetical protein